VNDLHESWPHAKTFERQILGQCVPTRALSSTLGTGEYKTKRIRWLGAATVRHALRFGRQLESLHAKIVVADFDCDPNEKPHRMAM